MDILKEFESRKKKYYEDVANKNYIESNKIELQERVNYCKELDDRFKKANTILDKASTKTREVAKHKIETIVTNALQYTYDEDIKFIVDLSTKRGVPSVDFKIETIVDGKKSIKNPIYSNGGGIVDVISTTLRYAYLMSLDAGLAKIIMLDEPGKMVSEGISAKYSEFVYNLAESFDIQTIFITHNNSLENSSSNIIEVDKINGVSQIRYI